MYVKVFSGLLPGVVTSSFASKFLLALSAANLGIWVKWFISCYIDGNMGRCISEGGRIAWAALSDSIGRRKTFLLFTLGSIPLYLALPGLVEATVATGSATNLYSFILSTGRRCIYIYKSIYNYIPGPGLAVSMMGGTFAILPAYEADLFGTKNVGPIHGRMLLYASAAALAGALYRPYEMKSRPYWSLMAGPSLLLTLRSRSEMAAINDLLSKVSPLFYLYILDIAREK